MRFFQTLFAGAAFVAAAAALEINDFPSTVEAGNTYTITYSPASDTPTTFLLRQGLNEDLATVTTLTTTATNGEFEWTVSDDLPNAADYALEIRQGDLANFIGPVSLSGSDATSTASPSATSSSAPSSSADSSSADSSSSASSSDASSTTTALSTTETSESTITSVTASPTASGSVSSSIGLNSTISSATLSTSGTGRPASSATATGGVPETTGAAVSLGSSPMMAMFGAFAAMVYLN